MSECKLLKNISIKLSDEHKKKIDALRKKEGRRSASSIVREALELYFSKQKEGA